VVPGSLVLRGGSSGLGKSTLTNMALGDQQESGQRTLYVSCEEFAEQVRLRAERLGAGGAWGTPVCGVCELLSRTTASEACRHVGEKPGFVSNFAAG
jgi:DNA repair protein RadA/Sms